MADEIVNRLVLDGGEILKVIAELRDGLIEVSKASGLTEKQIQDAFDKAAVSAKRYDKALDDAVKANQDLVASSAQLTKAEQNYNKTAGAVDKLGDELDDARKSAKNLGDTADKSRDQFGKFTKQAEGGISKISGLLKTGARLIGGFFAVQQVLQFGRAVFAAGAQFQKFQAQLTTALGNRSEARRALALLSDFAKTTPFELAELTEAYVKFANRGLRLTQAELTKLGDLAASQGKSFLQLTEAVLDAGTGEFERLKEFGIKASQSGDQVRLAFKGQTVEVEKNEAAIQKAVIALGALDGVAGGMALQSQTLGGQLSNLQDSFGQLAATLGQKLSPVFGSILSGLTSVFGALNDFAREKSIEDLSSQFDAQIDSVTTLQTSIVPLADRYDELQAKAKALGGETKLSKDEQDEMKKIIGQVATAIPTAVTAFDAYGNAISINTGKVREFVEQQALALQFQNKDLIKQTNERVKELGATRKILEDQINFYSKGQGSEIEAVVRDKTQRLKEVSTELAGAQAFLKQLNGDFIKDRQERIEADKKARAEQDTEAAKKAAADKAAADAAKNADKNQRETEKNERERLQNQQELIQLQAELNQARIQLLEDGIAKEKALENEGNRGKIAELTFKKLTATAEQEQVLNQLIEAENERHQAALIEIDKRAAQERIALAQQLNDDINASIGNDRDRELAEFDANTEKQLQALRERYQGNEQVLTGLVLNTIINRNKERDELLQKFSIEDLNKQEQKDKALAELSIENEQARQVALLNITIEYAKKRRALLVANGAAENEIEILNLDKVIKDAEAGLKKLEPRGQGLQDGIFKLLGLGALKDGDKDKIAAAFGSTVNNIFQAISDGARANLEAKQQEVEEYDRQIDDLEDALDREYRLREQGLANNASIREQELASVKAQRDKALAEEKAAQEKAQQIQKAQIILDSVVQGSNLVTASTDIFKALAKIPGVGIPLAIGLIATMFGAFGAAKIQALKLTGVQRFADGGEIGGKSHSQGGNKYMSIDGNDSTVMEIEQGEWITKKKQARKYRPLLEAINDDSIGAWSFDDLARYAGIRPELDQKVMDDARAISSEARSVLALPVLPSKELKSIDKNIGDLLAHEKSKPESWDEGEYRVYKKGSVTRRIKKG